MFDLSSISEGSLNKNKILQENSRNNGNNLHGT